MSRGIPAMMMYSGKKTPMKIVRSMDRAQANSLEQSLSRQGELGILAQRVVADAATAAIGLPCSNPSRIARVFAVKLAHSIAHEQSRAFCSRARVDGPNDPVPVGVTLERKPKLSADNFLLLQQQPGFGKYGFIRQWLCIRDILSKEIFK